MDSLRLHDFIGSTLYITIGEDRFIKGTLVALDAQVNLLLNHVQEHNSLMLEQSQRSMGLVSVPKSSITSVKIVDNELENIVEYKQEFLKSIN